MKANPNNQDFLDIVKSLEVGDAIDVDSGILVLEHKFSMPTHFNFHQRIFSAGVILKKQDSNVRIYIEAEKLDMDVTSIDHEDFDDKQIVDGVIQAPDRGLKRN